MKTSLNAEHPVGFHIFGVTFWPQDFLFLAWALIIAALGLFFVTVFAGRVYCGYVCPQTAWTRLFMAIEQRCEGDRHQRLKWDRAPWGAEKLLRRGLKHVLWLALALATGVTFVGYFTPIRELIPDFFQMAANHWAYIWIGIFTVLTYLNAGWMREQVCIYMCPYARFQSVMYDRDTLAVSYDYNRGEPRGKRSKKAADAEQQNTLGDCVDCSLCVQVCPTGIDIRDGMQYQCIGCALCVDACDSIMEKLNKPKGLVRYTTENELEGQKTHFFRPRLVGYAVVMLVMLTAFSYALMTRTGFRLDIERDRGALYQWTVNDTVTNSYTVKLMNMSQSDREYLLTLSAPEGITMDADEHQFLKVNELKEVLVTLEMDPEVANLKATKVDVEFVVSDPASGEEIEREETRFIAPRQ